MRVALSITVKMESFLFFVTGRSVIKSKDTSVHFSSGIFVDWSFPRFSVWSDFAT